MLNPSFAWSRARRKRGRARSPELFSTDFVCSRCSVACMIARCRILDRYRRVAFLECDPGQSEFTPAGMVALNIVERPVFGEGGHFLLALSVRMLTALYSGPPFSHPSIPNSAHYIGATSPRSSPSHYLAAVQELIRFYRLDVQTPVDMLETSDSSDRRVTDVIPLVVNTMGWNKGLGADLALRIQEIAEPTDVFDIESPVIDPSWLVPYVSPPRLQEGREVSAQYGGSRLHALQPISTTVQMAIFSPADFRNLSILSYFHALFPLDIVPELRQVSAVSWNIALPLCAQPPYEVDWNMAVEKVVLIGAGMEDVVPSEIERVLNGALVGLVSCEPGSLDEDTSMEVESRIPYTQGLSAPSPSTSVCRGLALVRALSPTSSHMHMVTPVPPHVLADGRVLVKGELELPIWGLLDFRNEGGEMTTKGVDLQKAPFLRWGKNEGIGTERRRIRRNLMRKGQM